MWHYWLFLQVNIRKKTDTEYQENIFMYSVKWPFCHDTIFLPYYPNYSHVPQSLKSDPVCCLRSLWVYMWAVRLILRLGKTDPIHQKSPWWTWSWVLINSLEIFFLLNWPERVENARCPQTSDVMSTAYKLCILHLSAIHAYLNRPTVRLFQHPHNSVFICLCQVWDNNMLQNLQMSKIFSEDLRQTNGRHFCHEPSKSLSNRWATKP